jgi:uncharacterized protein (DUF362 family)
MSHEESSMPEEAENTRAGQDQAEASKPKSRRTTRRKVLLWGGSTLAVGVGGGAAAFAYGRQLLGESAPPMRDHQVQRAESAPRMVIARGKDPARNVAAALSGLGGMSQFVGRDDRVLIKPNIAWDRVPAQAANTDPTVVAAVVRACREAGARDVWVADCPVKDAETTFQRSGIHRAAHDAGAKVILPDMSRYLQIGIPGKSGTWPILELFLQADKIINVPVAKVHDHGGITAGMKNWFGVLGMERVMLHAGIDQSIAGLAELMKPTLTVIDATRILMRNGPSGGDLGDVKRVDAVAVSTDPVAADAWAAQVLEIAPDRVGALAVAAGRGLGTADLRAVAPVEIKAG